MEEPRFHNVMREPLPPHVDFDSQVLPRRPGLWMLRWIVSRRARFDSINEVSLLRSQNLMLARARSATVPRSATTTRCTSLSALVSPTIPPSRRLLSRTGPATVLGAVTAAGPTSLSIPFSPVLFGSRLELLLVPRICAANIHRTLVVTRATPFSDLATPSRFYLRCAKVALPCIPRGAGTMLALAHFNGDTAASKVALVTPSALIQH